MLRIDVEKEMELVRDMESRVIASQVVAVAKEASIDIPQTIILLVTQIDELVAALKSRPILVINLMLTSKAMVELFTVRVPGFWRLLLEQLIAKEHGEYTALVYPFFICEQDAAMERYKRMLDRFDWPLDMKSLIIDLSEGKRWKIYPNLQKWQTEEGDRLTVFYGNGLFSQYKELVDYGSALARMLAPTFIMHSASGVSLHDSLREAGVYVYDESGESLRVTLNPVTHSTKRILSLSSSEI